MDNYFYILEFSEKNQCFNFNDGRAQQNTFGYRTICANISMEQMIEFTEKMAEYYPENYPSFQYIIIEFEKFLLSTPSTSI